MLWTIFLRGLTKRASYLHCTWRLRQLAHTSGLVKPGEKGNPSRACDRRTTPVVVCRLFTSLVLWKHTGAIAWSGWPRFGLLVSIVGCSGSSSTSSSAKQSGVFLLLAMAPHHFFPPSEPSHPETNSGANSGMNSSLFPFSSVKRSKDIALM